MKTALLAVLGLTVAFNANASDYQSVTETTYNYSYAYAQAETITQSVQTETNLEPVEVYTGSTVTVQDHYEVYEPKVIYEKVGSYDRANVYEF